MRHTIGLDDQPEKPTSEAKEIVKAIGRNAESIGLLVPGVRNVIARKRPARPVDESTGQDFVARRLATVSGFISPLDFEVPARVPTRGPVNAVSELGVKWSEKWNERVQKKAARARSKLAETLAEADGAKYQSSGDGEAPAEAEKTKEENKAEKRLKRRQGKVAVEDRREQTAASGILWLVIVNAGPVDSVTARSD